MNKQLEYFHNTHKTPRNRCNMIMSSHVAEQIYRGDFGLFFDNTLGEGVVIYCHFGYIGR